MEVYQQNNVYLVSHWGRVCPNLTGFFFVGSNGEAIVFYSYRRVSNFHKKMGCSS